MDANWAKIKAEYVAQGTPYRELCQKYGVNLKTLARRAKKECWVELRETRDNAVRKAAIEAEQARVHKKAENDHREYNRCLQKCIQRTEEKAVREVDRMFAATDKLLKKAEQLLEIEDALAPRDLRSLSSTLLDVRTLLGIRDEADREEQKTRIEKMRAEIAALQEDKTEQNRIEVVWVSNPWDQEEDDGNDGNE